jgi:2-methylcitrate dehydratase
MTAIRSDARRAEPDPELTAIARYVSAPLNDLEGALEAARLCLMDALSCAFMALPDPECTKLLGPVVPETVVPNGARVPGTTYVLDPVKAAFDVSTLVRWLDFSDTWWAGGHPSDNVGAVLATCDYLSRAHVAAGRPPLLMRDVLEALVKAYEIHGVLSCGNRVDGPDVGLCSTLLVKIASTAVAARLLGANGEEIVNALSNAFVDGGSLNVYRKGRHAGTRKNWAAGDATSRGVQLAMIAMRGEMGYPGALSAKTWGFCDVLYQGRRFEIPQAFGTEVIRNIQFKISYPAQRHTQTAAECAVRLHPHVAMRLAEIDKVVLSTHKLALEMVSVTGPLPTAAARDHCLQYVAAVGLIHGHITHESYSDAFAADPRIDALRAKMVVQEDARYTAGYYDAATHSNANAIQVFFKDGSSTPKAEVEYLIGDPKRRAEGLPVLEAKFHASLADVFAPKQRAAIAALLGDRERLVRTPVHELMDLLVR